ncbi:methyl-accepting chemotaxis (MCP) signaling domain protein, partial [Vibrio parahaemolyticus AQ3810]
MIIIKTIEGQSCVNFLVRFLL